MVGTVVGFQQRSHPSDRFVNLVCSQVGESSAASAANVWDSCGILDNSSAICIKDKHANNHVAGGAA